MAFLDPAAELASEAVAGLERLGWEIFAELKTYGRSRIPVDSTAISALTYLRDRTLSIEFTDGSRYAIPDFPSIELARWLAASKGAYFNAHVRGKY
jgi:hypothetical protein